MNLKIRDYDQAIDENFVYSSWLRSSRMRCDFTKMPNSVYFPNYKRLIANCLANHNVLVACADDDHAHVLGYIVYEKCLDSKILYFAYTKFTYRKLGVFKRLMTEAFEGKPGIIFNSHRSPLTDEISKKYELIYNPFLFLGEK